MDEFQVVKKLGIPVAEGSVAKNAEAAVAIAEKIGYPIALKIKAEAISHKTEAKGIKLNLRSPVEVRIAFGEIVKNAKAYKKGAKIEGVRVQKYYEGGVEVILGLLKDNVFGYAVMFGSGGIFTEILADTTYRIAPINADEAMKMIKEIKGYAVLSGIRGRKTKDIKALAKAIASFSKLNEDESVLEAEINPLLVFEKGVVAVDARILRDE